LYFIYGMSLRYFLLLCCLLLLVSCARRGRPEGGPKDFDKPIMVKAVPDFKSLHFEEDEIKIYFDEYIKLKDVNSELIISPPLKYPVEISPLGTPSKKVTIKLRDTLKENATYTFNFAQSILDNTEGNVLDNFKYIFSTGDYIDSLQVNGPIKDAFDLEMIENPTIMLYPINEAYTDSVIYLEKPTYVGKTIDSLNWEVTNIKEGTYRLVALNDARKNYKYDPKEDKIAFHPDFISIPGDSIIKLTLFKESLPFKTVSRPKDVSKGHVIIGFEGDSEDVKIRVLSDVPNDFKAFYAKDIKTDTLNYWFNNYDKDTLIMEVSKNKFIDSIKIAVNEEEIDSMKLAFSSTGSLHLRDTFKLGSTVPIMKIDTAKFQLIDKDSIKVPFKLKLSANKSFIDFEFEKELQQKYKLFIAPGGVEDIFGVQNDTLKTNFRTGKTSDYCALFLTVQNIEKFPVIIDLMNDKGKLVGRKYATEAREYEFKNLRPARFMVRIIYDENGNQAWDTGNFLKKLQPEKVYYLSNIIEAKANWEVNENLIIKP
jgi:uncharacterized protein (DUF2141 family)